MKVKELLKMLRNDGWSEKDQKGSHLQLEHPVKKERLPCLYIGVIFQGEH